MAGSFLGKLPSAVGDQLLADGDRTDYPVGTTIHRVGGGVLSLGLGMIASRGLTSQFADSPACR
jgi:hypothetical protein